MFAMVTGEMHAGSRKQRLITVLKGTTTAVIVTVAMVAGGTALGENTTIAASDTLMRHVPPNDNPASSIDSSTPSIAGQSSASPKNTPTVGHTALQSAATQYYSANKLLSDGDGAAAIPILENLLKTESSPTLYSKIILAYETQGDYANATSRLEVALDLYRDNDTLRESGLLLYYSIQDYSRAMGLAKELEESETFDTSQALLYQTIIYADTREYKKGLKTIKRIEKIRGMEVSTDLLKGTMLLGLNKTKTAQEVFDRSFNATQGADFVLAHITSSYYFFEIYPPIVYFLERKAMLSEGNPRDLYLIQGAVLAFTLKDYANSSRLLEMVSTTNPSIRSSVYFNLGLNELLLGNTSQGVNYLEQSINTDMEDGKLPHSSEPYAYTSLAKAYLKESGYKAGDTIDNNNANSNNDSRRKAIATLNAGIKAYADVPENYLTAAIIYSDKSDRNLTQARKYLSEYGRLTNNSSDYYYWSSSLYLLDNKTAHAYNESTAGLELSPGNVPLLSVRTDACVALENYTCAIDSAEKLIQYGGETPDRLNTLGYLYASAGINLQEGELLVKKALKASPKNFYYLDSMAWVYHKQGNNKKAKKYIEKAKQAVINYEASLKKQGGEITPETIEVLNGAKEEIDEHMKDIEGANNANGNQ